MKKIVRNQEYDPKVLKKLHDLQLEMLQDLEKICDKYNLKYFAVFKGNFPGEAAYKKCMTRGDGRRRNERE